MKLRIKDMREDNDLTQKQISSFLLCDQSLYSKYERGERSIPIELLVKLADFYKVSLDYLTGRTDCPQINTNISDAEQKNRKSGTTETNDKK